MFQQQTQVQKSGKYEYNGQSLVWLARPIRLAQGSVAL